MRSNRFSSKGVHSRSPPSQQTSPNVPHQSNTRTTPSPVSKSSTPGKRHRLSLSFRSSGKHKAGLLRSPQAQSFRASRSQSSSDESDDTSSNSDEDNHSSSSRLNRTPLSLRKSSPSLRIKKQKSPALRRPNSNPHSRSTRFPIEYARDKIIVSLDNNTRENAHLEDWRVNTIEDEGMNIEVARQRLSKIACKISSTSLPPKFEWVSFQVKLHQAAGLTATDNIIMGGKADPYVIAEWEDSKGTVLYRRQTPYVPNTLRPSWNWDLNITANHASYATKATRIRFTVMDFDAGAEDDFLGQYLLQLQHDTSISEQPCELTAKSGDSDSKSRGFITLSVHRMHGFMTKGQLQHALRGIEREWQREQSALNSPDTQGQGGGSLNLNNELDRAMSLSPESNTNRSSSSNVHKSSFDIDRRVVEAKEDNASNEAPPLSESPFARGEVPVPVRTSSFDQRRGNTIPMPNLSSPSHQSASSSSGASRSPMRTSTRGSVRMSVMERAAAKPVTCIGNRGSYFEDWRSRQIESQQLNMTVARTKLANSVISISQEKDCKVPKGFVWRQFRLHVHNGAGLCAPDSFFSLSSMGFLGRSKDSKTRRSGNKANPYVRVDFLDRAGTVVICRETPFLQKTLAPDWDWDLTTTPKKQEDSERIVLALITVFSRNSSGSDDFLGQTRVDLHPRMPEIEQKAFNLDSLPGKPPKPRGFISLSVSMAQKRYKSRKGLKNKLRELQASWQGGIMAAQIKLAEARHSNSRGDDGFKKGIENVSRKSILFSPGRSRSLSRSCSSSSSSSTSQLATSETGAPTSTNDIKSTQVVLNTELFEDYHAAVQIGNWGAKKRSYLEDWKKKCFEKQVLDRSSALARLSSAHVQVEKAGHNFLWVQIRLTVHSASNLALHGVGEDEDDYPDDELNPYVVAEFLDSKNKVCFSRQTPCCLETNQPQFEWNLTTTAQHGDQALKVCRFRFLVMDKNLDAPDAPDRFLGMGDAEIGQDSSQALDHHACNLTNIPGMPGPFERHGHLVVSASFKIDQKNKRSFSKAAKKIQRQWREEIEEAGREIDRAGTLAKYQTNFSTNSPDSKHSPPPDSFNPNDSMGIAQHTQPPFYDSPPSHNQQQHNKPPPPNHPPPSLRSNVQDSSPFSSPTPASSSSSSSSSVSSTPPPSGGRGKRKSMIDHVFGMFSPRAGPSPRRVGGSPSMPSFKETDHGEKKASSSSKRHLRSPHRRASGGNIIRVVCDKNEERRSQNSFFEDWKLNVTEDVAGMVLRSAYSKLANTHVVLDDSKLPKSFNWNQISLHIHGANNLLKERSIFSVSSPKADVYCQVEFIDNQGQIVITRRTPYDCETLDPEWDWDLTTTPKRLINPINLIRVMAMENSSTSNDKFMGQVEIEIEPGMEDIEKKSFKLGSMPGHRAKERGTVTISVSYAQHELNKSGLKKALKYMYSTWQDEISFATDQL